MRILQLVAMAAIFAVVVRWAIREGSKPPEDEDRQLVIGYDDDGAPILAGDDCDVDKTMALWRDLNRKGRNT